MRMTTTPTDEASLKEARQQIETQLAAVNEATTERNRVAANCGMREQGVTTALAILDPTDVETVAALAVERAQLDVVRDWVNRAPKIHLTAMGLRAALFAAEPVIRSCCQERSIEEGAISVCLWTADLQHADVSPLGNQLKILADTAKQVLANIGVVLAARRPVILTDEERRSGMLRGPNNSVLRVLESGERLSGFAHA